MFNTDFGWNIDQYQYRITHIFRQYWIVLFILGIEKINNTYHTIENSMYIQLNRERRKKAMDFTIYTMVCQEKKIHGGIWVTFQYYKRIL